VKEIQWSARASDDLSSLDRGIARRIRTGILRYAETETGDVIRLQGEGRVFRRRVGDWRVRFELLPADQNPRNARAPSQPGLSLI
jgi:mRNA-degrading endonuclease RelE of RelBE toxin-antitoxin system